MVCCTFFGHRDCPEQVRPVLRETLVHLIENEGVSCFYVGNHGAFDAMARTLLRDLEKQYPQISYAVVLAYMPKEMGQELGRDFSDTMLPEGIETAPKRFAVSWRNKWMLAQSEYVITYVTHTWGDAAQFAEMAARKGKKLIPLGR